MIRIIYKCKNIVILLACFIIGLIRQKQIQTYQSSIGKPTMTGIFTLFSYIFVGVCLTLMLMILKLISHSKLGGTLKIIIKVIVFGIGLFLICL